MGRKKEVVRRIEVRSLFNVSNLLVQHVVDNMTLVEGRCLRLLLKQLYEKGLEIEEENTYILSAKNLAEFSEISLEKAKFELFQVEKEFSKLLPLSVIRKEGILRIWWFRWTYYDRNTHEMTIKFNKDIIPSITKLTKDFSSIPLEFCKVLDSKRHINMIEWLYSYNYQKCWRDNKFSVKLTSIEDFCELFSIPQTYVGNYPLLKRDILKPFMEDVKKKGLVEEIILEDKDSECKIGRKIVKFRFRFKFKAYSKSAKLLKTELRSKDEVLL